MMWRALMQERIAGHVGVIHAGLFPAATAVPSAVNASSPCWDREQRVCFDSVVS